MAKANVNDRRSLERAYPANAFARDAARNELASSAVLHGVRIDQAPDGGGTFALSRVQQHVGEPVARDFLAPVRRDAELIDEGRAPAQVAPPHPRGGYDRFLDDVVAAAKRFGFRPEDAPGRD